MCILLTATISKIKATFIFLSEICICIKGDNSQTNW